MDGGEEGDPGRWSHRTKGVWMRVRARCPWSCVETDWGGVSVDRVQNTLQEDLCFRASGCIYLFRQIQWDCWGEVGNGRTKGEREGTLKIIK